jgi:hypothetical protein
MSEANKKKLRHKNENITVRGEAAWTTLDKPDTKFKPEGEYKVDLRITEEQAKTLKAKMEPMAEAARKAEIEAADKPVAKKKIKEAKLVLPVKAELDKETGDETGEYIITIKCGAVKTIDGNKVNFKPSVVDAKKKPLDRPRIGRGSKLNVAAQLSPYYSSGLGQIGVSARLTAVQVLELVEMQGGPNGVDLFKEEDGFESAESEASGESAPFDSDEGDGKKGDF